jgi:LYAR-type C2HC zinc finger
MVAVAEISCRSLFTILTIYVCSFSECTNGQYPQTDDYRSHTSCISEMERYEKKARKGRQKRSPQELWMDLITTAGIQSAPVHLRPHLETIVGYDNVPRKEKAFHNFVANSLNLRAKHGDGVIVEMWNLLKGLRDRQLDEREHSTTMKGGVVKEIADGTKNATNEIECVGSERAKEPERQKDVTPTQQKESSSLSVVLAKGTSNSSEPSKKTVKKAMKKILKNNNDPLSIKSLRRLVRSQLLSCGGVSKSRLKELVQHNIEGSASFVVLEKGKTVALSRSHSKR